MPATNVSWPPPITNLSPVYMGQMGVPNSGTRRGLREHVSGVVFYVDPNYPGASVNADGVNPENPISSVTAALTRCVPYRGDTIAVMANNFWQYGNVVDGYRTPISENVVVDVPGVRIIGISQSSSTGVVWTPASNGGTCITVNAIDVLIEGFLFTEGSFTGCNAIAAVWDGTTAWGDNLTVRNCVFDSSIDIAISLDYAWFVNIHHNVFWECDSKGIYVVNPGSGAAYLVVSDNLFHDVVGCAMDLNNTDDSHVFNNSIFNQRAQAAAAAAGEGIVTTNGSHNQVFDNFFSCLLPVPANGDWNDLNTAAATDAWVGNHCMNGLAVSNPT